MESVKNIRNDELVKAYEALHTDNSKGAPGLLLRGRWCTLYFCCL